LRALYITIAVMADIEMADDLPPDGCHHYTDLGEVPWDIQKSEPLLTFVRHSLTIF